MEVWDALETCSRFLKPGSSPVRQLLGPHAVGEGRPHQKTKGCESDRHEIATEED